MKFKKVLTNTDFDLGLRIRFVNWYVWTVLLYGMEEWTLKVSTANKLEEFEMWVYRQSGFHGLQEDPTMRSWE